MSQEQAVNDARFSTDGDLQPLRIAGVDGLLVKGAIIHGLLPWYAERRVIVLFPHKHLPLVFVCEAIDFDSEYRAVAGDDEAVLRQTLRTFRFL